MSKGIFAVKLEGKVKYLRANRSKVNIPGFGKLSAEDFAENAGAVTFVMKNPSFHCILSEVPEKEYKGVIQAEEKAKADAEQKAKALALEAEKADYEIAKAIVSAYEAKYGGAETAKAPVKKVTKKQTP